MCPQARVTEERVSEAESHCQSAAMRTPRPHPAAPVPREKPLGTIGTLRAARTNPLEAFTRAHFELPIVSLKTVLGQMVFVSDPAAIQHVMVHNTANYRKDD